MQLRNHYMLVQTLEEELGDNTDNYKQLNHKLDFASNWSNHFSLYG